MRVRRRQAVGDPAPEDRRRGTEHQDLCSLMAARPGGGKAEVLLQVRGEHANDRVATTKRPLPSAKGRDRLLACATEILKSGTRKLGFSAARLAPSSRSDIGY